MSESDTRREEEGTNDSIVESKIRPIVAEFIGSIILVAVVCASSLIKGWDIILAGVVYGSMMVFLIVTFGDMSGGYFNPVITLGCTLAGSIPIPLAIGYFFAQVIGGIVGAALVRASYSRYTYRSGYYMSYKGPWYLSDAEDVLQSMAAEAVPTFILVLIVLITALDRKKRRFSPFAIGFFVTLSSFQSFSQSRGSTHMNPVLSFGPAVAFSGGSGYTNLWTHHYRFWVGPIVGALLASLLYRFVFALENKRIQIKKCCRAHMEKRSFDTEVTCKNNFDVEFKETVVKPA